MAKPDDKDKKDNKGKIIGTMVRSARRKRNLTQTELAEKFGLTHQQIQKYETGRTNITASRLQALAAYLEVPISSFFAESSGSAEKHSTGLSAEVIEIGQKLAAIESPTVRATLLTLIDAIAEELRGDQKSR